jgi:hypothetical protein
MVALRANEEEMTNAQISIAGSDQPLRRMRRAHEAQTVQGSAGKHECLLPSQILQSELHGSGNDRNHQGHEREEFTTAGGADGQDGMRGMREVGQPPSRPSRGREPAQQQSIEFADFVRLLPSARAFAKLCGDADTEDAVLALLKACNADRLVLDASHPSQEVWRSVIEENQDRLRVACAEGWWVTGPLHPLAHGVPGRVGRLRAYGNAIVPALAAEFIMASM